MQIKELLEKSRKKLIKNNIEDPNIISRLLMQFVLNIDRAKLIQCSQEQISEYNKQKYEKALQKIIEGVPLQYITNNQEFFGLNFYVDENVLIPQPDTEVLVEEVLSIAQKENKKEILDICTGSGCIGITLANKIKNSNITMSDISKKALEIAKKNAIKNNVIEKVNLIESNLFEKIEAKFDIIVSNPPYIETKIIKTLPKQVQNEPIIALDGGEDGLYFYNILLNEAPKYLKENGYLCVEIGYNQKEKIIELAEKTKKYTKIEAKKDLAGNDRVIICKK